MTQAILSLSVPEHQRLDALEDVIEQGRKAFIEVGNALTEIRDSRLYRQDYETFEDYCRDRWQMERAHAYRLIEASEVVQVLSPTGDMSLSLLGPVTDIPAPKTERVARELAPLRQEPEVMREVWRESVEVSGGQPTATVVRDVREQVVAARAAVREHIRNEAKEAVAAMEEATSHISPETRRLLTPEMMRQRGELMRLVSDLSRLEEPRGFANTHHTLINDLLMTNARNALDWLTTFIEVMKEYR